MATHTSTTSLKPLYLLGAARGRWERMELLVGCTTNLKGVISDAKEHGYM